MVNRWNRFPREVLVPLFGDAQKQVGHGPEQSGFVQLL